MTDKEYQDKFCWFDGDFSGVKSKERTRKFGEVFTPRWIVEKMLDEIPGCSEIGKTVFEPACGEGAFLCCVLRRKLEAAKTDAESVNACKDCYGVDIQYDNVILCRRKLVAIASAYGVNPDDARFIFARNVIHGDMIWFPMLCRFFDWQRDEWTNLETMASIPNVKTCCKPL